MNLLLSIAGNVTPFSRLLLIPAAMILFMALDAGAAEADLDIPKEAVTAGHDGLENITPPWYDLEADELKAIVYREPINWWDMSNPLNVLTWIGVAVLSICIVALLIYVLRHSMPHHVAPVAIRTTTELQADQVEALTFLAKRPRDDLLGQARLHYYQGNYAEAIIYLFSHELVELDKASLVRLAQGKTNRQYLREVSRVAPLKQLVETTMTTFEDVFFGQRPLDRAGFERCWNELPQFEELLRTAP